MSYKLGYVRGMGVMNLLTRELGARTGLLCVCLLGYLNMRLIVLGLFGKLITRRAGR